MFWLHRHLPAKQALNSKQSTTGYDRIIWEILRRSGYFSSNTSPVSKSSEFLVYLQFKRLKKLKKWYVLLGKRIALAQFLLIFFCIWNRSLFVIFLLFYRSDQVTTATGGHIACTTARQIMGMKRRQNKGRKQLGNSFPKEKGMLS